jgi:hypothetical protein
MISLMKILYSLRRFYHVEMLFNETYVLAGCDKKPPVLLGGLGKPDLSYLAVSMHAKAIVITITHFGINNTPSIRV